MLASQGQKSPEDLLTQWMEEYGPEVLGTLRRRGLTLVEAEDVMQEAFMKAYQNLHDGRPPRTNAKGWLKTIAINTATDYIRVRQAEARCREQMGKSGRLRDSYSPSTEDEQEANQRKLLALLDANRSFDSALSVVKWRFFEGWSFAQIGHRLGVSEMTAIRRYREALKMLRQALEDQDIKSQPEQS